MNILLASGIYPSKAGAPSSGGPATYSSELTHALRAQGHQVTVVAYGEVKAKEERHHEKTSSQEPKVIWVSRRGGVIVRYLRYAWAVYAQARKTEVIFAQGAVSEGVPAACIAKLLGKPFVMRIPGDYAWEMGRQFAPKRTEESLDKFLTHRHTGRVGIYERLERWTTSLADTVLVPSQYLRTVVLRWGIPSERIQVMKNAVQALPVTKGREALRKQQQQQDEVVCLTVARAVPWKGVRELISWWHRLPSSHVLVVAGDGPELESWKDLTKKEGLEGRVRFLGRIDRAHLAEWYDMADVFVLHTGYEGYPHTVPEAISRGLACLVSDQGGNPETQEEFGESVTVLPYQDRDAWVEALSRVSVRPSSSLPKLAWTHSQMVSAVEVMLGETIHPSANGATRVVMVGYERELLKTESSTFLRVSQFANERTTVSSLVIAQVPEDLATERDGLRVQAFAGSSFRRFFRAVYVGIIEARRLPGRTIVSGQDPFAAGLIAYFISRFTNQPLELQEHGDFWSGAWQKERWTHRIWAWVGERLLRRAESVRVVTERVKMHLVAQGVNAEKIAVIPVAQDLSGLLAKPLVAQNKGEWILRAPCRFVPQKGLDVLLKAFARVHERHLNTRLEIVGAGPLGSWLEKEIARLGLSRVVDIRPWMPSEELWDGADIYVMSSLYEGFGRTVVEAMAAGVSIVATDVGCVGSVLRPTIDGLVVHAGSAQALSEAITHLLEHDDERERMRLSARARAESLEASGVLQQKQRDHWLKALFAQRAQTVGPRFELWALAFFLFAIFTRALSVWLFHAQLLSREWGFFILVQHWFQGYGYSFATVKGCASAYRSPGYLFFLTALYSVFNPANTWAQAIVQNIFVVAALWLTYIVGKRLVGPRAGLVGGFIMACYPYTFYHYTQFYHTFLQSFFLLLVVWFVLRFADTKRLSYAVASGFAIGALAYVQGTILPVTPFISLWLVWQLWAEKKRVFIGIALMAICSAGLIAPWTYRNWTVFHHFIPLTTDLGHALIKANNENIYEITKRGYPQEIIEDVPSSTNPLYKQYRLPAALEADLRQAGVFHESILWTEWHPKEPVRDLAQCSDRGLTDEYTFNQYWLEKTKEQWRDHWGWEMWRLPLQKISTFWRPGLFPFVKTGAPWSFAGNAWKEWLARMSVLVSTGIVIILGWIGWLVQAVRRRRTPWLTLSFFVVFTLLHSIIAGYTKYRIPLDHLLAAYAGWCLVAVWDWIRGRRL